MRQARIGLHAVRRDDLAISALFDLEESGFPCLVDRILRENGFNVNQDKRSSGTIAKGVP